MAETGSNIAVDGLKSHSVCHVVCLRISNLSLGGPTTSAGPSIKPSSLASPCVACMRSSSDRSEFQSTSPQLFGQYSMNMGSNLDRH